MREIIKVGLACFQSEDLLLVRKKGSSVFILPGGKPEAGEDNLSALHREVDEELGCRIKPESIASFGVFSDVAADHVDTMVHVRLYGGLLDGAPAACSEIEELLWVDPTCPGAVVMAPSLTNQILPFLAEAMAFGRLSPWIDKNAATTPIISSSTGLAQDKPSL